MLLFIQLQLLCKEVYAFIALLIHNTTEGKRTCNYLRSMFCSSLFKQNHDPSFDMYISIIYEKGDNVLSLNTEIAWNHNMLVSYVLIRMGDGFCLFGFFGGFLLFFVF